MPNHGSSGRVAIRSIVLHIESAFRPLRQRRIGPVVPAVDPLGIGMDHRRERRPHAASPPILAEHLVRTAMPCRRPRGW